MLVIYTTQIAGQFDAADCDWRRSILYAGTISHQKCVTGPSQILRENYDRLSALNEMLEGVSEVLEKWKEDDSRRWETVTIERTPGEMKAPSETLLLQSWLPKISRQTESLILKGIVKTSKHPVSGGGFSDIYKVRCRDQEVALKVLRIHGTQRNCHALFKEVSREALFWKNLDHPNILPFLGISQDAISPYLCLVSPWMSNGNVLDYMESHDDVNELLLVAQCALGVLYLHEFGPGLVHGDIKGANILIDGIGNPRITDFGSIAITESHAGFTTTRPAAEHGGSVRWMAPELFNPEVKKSRSADVYAFGMTVFEIFTRSPPFALKNYRNDIQVAMDVLRGERPGRPIELVKLEDGLWMLINRCWCHPASCRPGMREVAETLEYFLTETDRIKYSQCLPYQHPFISLD